MTRKESLPPAETQGLQEAWGRLTHIQSLLAPKATPTETAVSAARASRELRAISDQLLADAATIAVLNGMSGRQVAIEAGVNHDTVRRALARSQTLSPYAEGEGRRRIVKSDGINRARRSLS